MCRRHTPVCGACRRPVGGRSLTSAHGQERPPTHDYTLHRCASPFPAKVGHGCSWLVLHPSPAAPHRPHPPSPDGCCGVRRSVRATTCSTIRPSSMLAAAAWQRACPRRCCQRHLQHEIAPRVHSRALGNRSKDCACTSARWLVHFVTHVASPQRAPDEPVLCSADVVAVSAR